MTRKELIDELDEFSLFVSPYDYEGKEQIEILLNNKDDLKYIIQLLNDYSCEYEDGDYIRKKAKQLIKEIRRTINEL